MPRRPVGLAFTHALAWLLAIDRLRAAVRAFYYTSGPLIEFEVRERVITDISKRAFVGLRSGATMQLSIAKLARAAGWRSA